MHLSSCEHPKLIRNPYTHDWQYVPCGSCSTCLTNRSFTLVQRLELECHYTKYKLFCTLTYDNNHIPRMQVFNGVALDSSFNHTSYERGLVRFKLQDCLMQDKDFKFLDKIGNSFPYLSHYDAQCFIKRLRINLYRLVKKEHKDEKESLLRFFLCGEYGPRNYRPHFHVILLTNSEFASSHLESLVRKSWTFGFIDTSFIANTASSYVAQYVNCTSYLPAFLRKREIRPFCHYSRCPTIGYSYFGIEKMQEIFNTCTPTFDYPDFEQRKFSTCPLWRGIEDRIFPKLPKFSRLSHSSRTSLYRLALEFPWFTVKNFERWAKGSLHVDERHALLRDLTDNFMLQSTLWRIWYMSKHVVFYSSLFGVSVETYVNHIEQYYKNKDYVKLKEQYKFSEEFTKEHDSKYLVHFDRFWLKMVSQFDASSSKCLPEFIRICSQLRSFGIDPDLFYSADLTKRDIYRKSFSLAMCPDFYEMVANRNKIVQDTTKTKKKNDYLASHGLCLSDLYG